MSDDVKPVEAPKPTGVFVPLPVLVALALAFAGLVASYVFVSQVDFLVHAKTEGERVTVVEETVKHHAKAIEKIDRRTEAIDANVRTLMTEQGVAPEKITVPKENP